MEDIIKRGEDLHNAKKYEQAIVCFDEAIRKYPTSSIGYINKGMACEELGEIYRALACYDKLLELEPDEDTAQGFEQRAELLHRLKRDGEAIESIDKVLELRDEFELDFFGIDFTKGMMLIRFYDMTKNPDLLRKAIQCFDTEHKIGNPYFYPVMWKGLAYKRLNAPEQELECYDLVIQNLDDSVFVHKFEAAEASYFRAHVMYRLGRHKKAIENLDYALSNSGSSEVEYNDNTSFQHSDSSYKHNLSNLNDVSTEARFWADEEVRLNPEKPFSYIWKGIAHEFLNEKNMALACYDNIKNLDQDEYTAYGFYRHAYALFKCGQNRNAIKSIARVSELDPSYRGAHALRGDILRDDAKNTSNSDLLREAIKCYDKEIDLDPSDSIIHIKKGQTYEELGEEESALACYDKLLNLDPDENTARGFYLRACVQYNLAQGNEAITSLDKTLELEPEHDDANRLKGKILTDIYNMTRKPDLLREAIACFDKVLESNPSEHQMHLCKTKAYQELKEWRIALDCCEKALGTGEAPHGTLQLFFDRMTILQELGQTQEASEMMDLTIDTITKISPNDPQLKDLKRLNQAMLQGHTVNVKVSNPDDNSIRLNVQSNASVEKNRTSDADKPDQDPEQSDIPKTEDQTHEFKEFFQYDRKMAHEKNPEAVKGLRKTALKEIARAICAFGNSYDGGFLYIGINSKGEIVGLDLDKERPENHKKLFLNYKDDFANYMIDVLKNFIKDESFTPDLISIDFKTIREKIICIITINPATQPLYFGHNKEEEFYVRSSAPRAQILKGRERDRYIRKRFPNFE